MKSKSLILLVTSCFVLTGCNILKKIRNLIPDEDYEDDDNYDSGIDDGNAATIIKKAVTAYNNHNYQIDYRQTTNDVSINMLYLVDGYRAKVEEDYYDYTNANSTGTADAYYYDEDSQQYSFDTINVNAEPGYSKFITRGQLANSDFDYDSEKNEFFMTTAGLFKYELTNCTMKVKLSGSDVVKLHFEMTSQVTTGGYSAETSIIADYTRIGEIHLTLPTLYA